MKLIILELVNRFNYRYFAYNLALVKLKRVDFDSLDSFSSLSYLKNSNCCITMSYSCLMPVENQSFTMFNALASP